ncbi:protein MIZU-KUSSEI 1-like [Macadamia integrifolia]|uniref:protein MIZU-KUSSEI 1-like n=1 Tax=Macadamia integrifolia TaxID=60698 RepID=UPI001C4E9E64|nr:protein MIZU-KUSSEI 1-like [Macadamia integrifolia]
MPESIAQDLQQQQQRPQPRPEQQQQQPQPQSRPVSPLATPSPSRQSISLQQPSKKGKASKPGKIYRQVRSLFRAFPIITPCRVPVTIHGNKPQNGHIHGGTRMTGTLYGYRKSRVCLAIQENPRCLPMLILELGVPTGKLLQEMGSGLMRMTLECEKQAVEKTKLLQERLWTMYCNNRKVGYGTKKDPTEVDLNVMQMLHAVSMGAGVLPTENTDMPDGELTYMRAHFERVIGNKDSETFYVMNPDGNSGPELSIFFVRI